MGLEITRKPKKTIKVGGALSLILGLLAFIVAIFLSGWLCLLIIPLYFIGLLGSVLGAIPFVGPVFYYFGVGWLFNTITATTGLDPISSGILFYSNLVFSIVYCFVTSSLLVIWLALRRKLKKLGKANKTLEVLINLGRKKKD